MTGWLAELSPPKGLSARPWGVHSLSASRDRRPSRLGPIAFDEARAERGESRVSNKHWIDRGWVWALIWPLFFAAPTTINAFSVLSEAAQRGFAVKPWEPFAWEYTSLAASLAAVTPFTLILSSVWPARPWWRFIAPWAAATALHPASRRPHGAGAQGDLHRYWRSL